MTTRLYEIVVGDEAYALEVDVDVRHGEVARIEIVGGDVPPSLAQDILGELERVVDLDRVEIEEGCEEDARDRAMDEKVSSWKENRR